MHSKLMQWLGVLLVLGLVGTSAGGLLVLKDRVRIIVQADQVAPGPDPAALLRDDVQVLAREFGELQQSLAGNFERLGTALEQRAEARHADVAALRQELAALRQQLDGQVRESRALSARLQELPQVAAPQLEPRVAPLALPAHPEPDTTQPAAPPAVTEPVAVAEKKGTGFLSFTLPSTQFHFDRAQDYVLVPDLCRVGFDAKSTLHDFSGVTSKLTGRFTADFDDPQGAWRGEVTVEARTLVTGVEGRDAAMYEHLDAKANAQIRFVVERFAPAPNGVDVGKQTARGDIVGRMTIRGQTRELTMPVAIEVDAQKRVVVTGQAPLKLSDYGVPVPSQLGIINMQDEVVVWVALRARVQTGGGR
ncbi:MAG TPA: YceI family protein [Planctomycetota bacterium]|nr:YceI family protein [Planctomycetota bacterium]